MTAREVFARGLAPPPPKARRKKKKGDSGGGRIMKRKAKKFLGLPSLTRTTRLRLARPLLTLSPRPGKHARPRLRLHVPILRLVFQPPPEQSYRAAKAQLKFTRQAARQRRTFDAQEKAAVHALIRSEAADLGERRRQAREGHREDMRQRREAETAPRRRKTLRSTDFPI